jgi:hypothetical protein
MGTVCVVIPITTSKAVDLGGRGKGKIARCSAAFRLLVLIGCVLASILPAEAHYQEHTAIAAAGGIQIPSLSHGQMAVIAGYRSAILDLAARQHRPDPVLRRLTNFARIQYTYCLWGIMPGSLSDDDSPFNECMHAALAATQALLLHIQSTADNEDTTQALTSEIETDMLRNHASLTLCRYSGESFNTAAVISPRWSEIFFHAPTLAACVGLILIMLGPSAFLLRLSAARAPGVEVAVDRC